MQPYKKLSGQSAVVAYEYGTDYITVRFQSGDYTTYTYRYGKAGISNVEQMKQLADAGRGLNTFINQNVRKLYSERF